MTQLKSLITYACYLVLLTYINTNSNIELVLMPIYMKNS